MDTETIIRKIKENKVVVIATLAIVLIIIGLLIKSYGASTPVLAPGPVSLTGEFACLPYKDNFDKGGCTLGIKDGGNYYAISTSSISLAVIDLKANEKIAVSGDLIPASQIKAENLKQYDIAGLINLESLTRAK